MVMSFESPGSIVTFEGGAKRIDFNLILNRLFLKFNVPSRSESMFLKSDQRPLNCLQLVQQFRTCDLV